MPRFTERPQKDDRVYRQNAQGERIEHGVVIELVSQRTKRPYLTVKITSGRRRGALEFFDRGGWIVDTTVNPACDRPDHDEPSYSLGMASRRRRRL